MFIHEEGKDLTPTTLTIVRIISVGWVEVELTQELNRAKYSLVKTTIKTRTLKNNPLRVSSYSLGRQI
jgi:hypothetical protein